MCRKFGEMVRKGVGRFYCHNASATGVATPRE